MPKKHNYANWSPYLDPKNPKHQHPDWTLDDWRKALANRERRMRKYDEIDAERAKATHPLDRQMVPDLIRHNEQVLIDVAKENIAWMLREAEDSVTGTESEEP